MIADAGLALFLAFILPLSCQALALQDDLDQLNGDLRLLPAL